MRSSEDIKRLVRNAEMRSDQEVNQAVLSDLLQQIEQTQEQRPAVTQPSIGRSFMKNQITRLAAAAAIAVAVLIAMNQFGGSNGSVVWGEVAKKVEASPGIILRCKEHNLDEPNVDGHLMIYNCPTRSRTDRHENGRITLSIYQNFEARSTVYVAHDRKAYLQETMNDRTAQEHESLMDPRHFVQRLQSCEHSNLGPKTVEGVHWEGLGTTDPAFSPANFPVSSLIAQLWVSVETGYPILMQIEVAGGDDGKLRMRSVCDRFEWDVELEPSEFEPNIPSDYEQM